jgi:hypothetical protein
VPRELFCGAGTTQLTRFTDYALRVLIYLGDRGRGTTIPLRLASSFRAGVLRRCLRRDSKF